MHDSEPTIPASFATPLSIRWSKKARSSSLSFSSAAKVYFGKSSANAAAEDHLTVLVLDRLGEDKPVGWIDGAPQGSLRQAVCFKGSGDKGRGVDDDDQIRRSARHSSSSAKRDCVAPPWRGP
jgi:hypothetical protein